MLSAHGWAECSKLCSFQFYGTASADDVKAEIDAGADVTATDAKGLKPLHYAALKGTPGIVQVLLDAGANVNTTDSNETTPLHYAGFNGTPSVVNLLLKQGANPNATDEIGLTPLHYVYMSDAMPKVIQSLLDAGADPEANAAGFTPEEGVKIIEEDKGLTETFSGLVKILNPCDKLCDQYWMSEASHSDLKEELYNRSSPNAKDDRGKTPLFYASQFGDITSLKILLEAGADPLAKDNSSSTVLHWGLGTKDHILKLQTLIKAGIKVNDKDDTDSSSLHYLAKYGPEIIRILIEEGAEVNALNKEKKTPLHKVTNSRSEPGCIQALIDAGANVNVADIRGYTPLHFAGHNYKLIEDPETVKFYSDNIQLLIDAGADVNAKAREGERPWDLISNDLKGSDGYIALKTATCGKGNFFTNLFGICG